MFLLFKGNGYTFSVRVAELFCLPSEKGSTLKRKNFAPFGSKFFFVFFFSFRVDLFFRRGGVYSERSKTSFQKRKGSILKGLKPLFGRGRKRSKTSFQKRKGSILKGLP